MKNPLAYYIKAAKNLKSFLQDWASNRPLLDQMKTNPLYWNRVDCWSANESRMKKSLCWKIKGTYWNLLKLIIQALSRKV
jgi:hypothetical protein